jgi:enoyl-CoA hydratase/carnithine racemase
MPEVKLGIPSVIEAALLPRLIGWGRTAELVLLGENVAAETIDRWGFFNVLVPPADLDREVARALDSILVAGPEAVRRQKALMRRWEDAPLKDAIEAGVDAFARSFETDEPRCMMRAALDALAAKKRK